MIAAARASPADHRRLSTQLSIDASAHSISGASMRPVRDVARKWLEHSSDNAATTAAIGRLRLQSQVAIPTIVSQPATAAGMRTDQASITPPRNRATAATNQ